MTIGAFLLLTNINSQLEKVSYERENVSDDWLYYAGKKRECTGKANTTSALVNGAGLTDCGGDLAVEAKLKIVSISDIYHNYCNMGFGVAVYGCTIPLTTFVYDAIISFFYFLGYSQLLRIWIPFSLRIVLTVSPVIPVMVRTFDHLLSEIVQFNRGKSTDFADAEKSKNWCGIF